MCGAGNTAIGKILWAARATRGGTERTCEQQLQGGVAGEAIPKGAGGELVNVEDDTKLATGWGQDTKRPYPASPDLRSRETTPTDLRKRRNKE